MFGSGFFKKSDAKGGKKVAEPLPPAPVPVPAPNVAARPSPRPTIDVVASVTGLSASSTNLGKQTMSPGVSNKPGLDVPRIRPFPTGEGAAAAWTAAVASCDLSSMAGLLKNGGVVIDQEIDMVRGALFGADVRKP